jgi:hypothetical protein
MLTFWLMVAGVWFATGFLSFWFIWWIDTRGACESITVGKLLHSFVASAFAPLVVLIACGTLISMLSDWWRYKGYSDIVLIRCKDDKREP